MNIFKIFHLLALLLTNENKQNYYCPECGNSPIAFKKGKNIIVYVCGRGHIWYEKKSIFDKRQ